MKIDWKRKLSSRKFWAALIGFITPLLVMLGLPESEVTQVAALVMSAGSLIAYIFSEGWVDASRQEMYVEAPEEDEEFLAETEE